MKTPPPPTAQMSPSSWSWKWNHSSPNPTSTCTDDCDESTTKYPASFPPTLMFSPWTKKAPIIVCSLFLLLFLLVLPCCVFYTFTCLSDAKMATDLAISCASLGLGALMEVPLRVYRLSVQREKYAPLGQEARWGFDFLFWWYNIVLGIGVVSYTLSTALENGPIRWVFLMTPGFIVGFAVVTGVVSAIPFRLPVRVSSDGKGERCKPFVYYVVEDFVAVDAGQMWGYRERLQSRWNSSPIFRRLIWLINLWWILGGILFIGSLAAITWGTSFEVAYGLSLGLFFVWIGIWAMGTWWAVERELLTELDWFAQERAKREFKKALEYIGS